MTEREKMLSGLLYDPTEPELLARRTLVRRLCRQFNIADEEDMELRTRLLDEILGSHGDNVFMEPDIRFDYGCNTHVGKNFFSNFNCVVLDCAEVMIGDNAFFGPNISLLTPKHPLIARERNLRTAPDGHLYDLEYAAPIHIGDNVWLGGGVTVCGGVNIGAGAVIGAGSVVTRDIPANAIAAGAPCRVIREITEADAVEARLRV